MAMSTTTVIDRARLKELVEKEEATYLQRNPQSLARHQEAKQSFLRGVPMLWMVRFGGVVCVLERRVCAAWRGAVASDWHVRAHARAQTHNPKTPQVRSAGRFPLYVVDAKGSRFRDVDGHEYLDLCLGDTGAMVRLCLCCYCA